jgi:hypothetical protein
MRSRNQLPCVNQEAPNMRVWMQQGAPDILIRHTWNYINLGVLLQCMRPLQASERRAGSGCRNISCCLHSMAE